MSNKFQTDENGILTREAIRLLDEQWQREYEDIDMTDAEWDMLRDSLLVKAQALATRDHLAAREAKKVEEATRENFNKGWAARDVDVKYFSEQARIEERKKIGIDLAHIVEHIATEAVSKDLWGYLESLQSSQKE